MAANSLVDITFPASSSAPVGARRVLLHQEGGKHDYAVLRFRLPSITTDTFRSGYPVQFSYGPAGRRDFFYGYVHHTEPVFDTVYQSIEVHCVGASFVFNDATSTVYRASTVQQVALQIASRYMLRIG